MGDRRTERWEGHRAEMRRRLVDAAVRAIEDIGPNVSMREIAAEANVPKPTIYRFFKDKSALAAAIAERAQEDIIARLAEVREHTPPTIGGLVHAALSGYAALLVDNPQVARFLLTGVDNPGVKATENWQAIAREVAAVMSLIFTALGSDDGDHMFHASMIAGAVTGAADWWFTGDEPAGAAADFVARVEPTVRAVLRIAAAEDRLAIDFDQPLAVPL
ncbi:transcriptional regulator, TetR family [Nocardia nova SH22a]|uniref:Transcriptional regulator, TetR family n=1 Tax=Nocardia nova SH22a TaxID=1415166 RepID=W5TLY7_9NOCA|nr:TetR/AcrR family transcriptional regulator [Nocardia nova]AHH19978.1 transcriptional regulator, TetR family [Nocardia nova SH22a]